MSISINDGKATPLAHVFSQDREQQGSTPALFVNRASTDGPMGWETIEAHARLATKSSDEHVQRFVLKIPKIGIKDGAPYVIGTTKVFLTVASGNAVSGESDLKDAITLMANWASNAIVKTAVQKLQPLVG